MTVGDVIRFWIDRSIGNGGAVRNCAVEIERADHEAYLVRALASRVARTGSESADGRSATVQARTA